MAVRVELTQGSAVGDQSGMVRIYENEELVYSVTAHLDQGHGANMELCPYVRLEKCVPEKRLSEKDILDKLI